MVSKTQQIMKLHLNAAFKDSGITKTTLSRRMGLNSHHHANKLLDVDSNSEVDNIARALECLGKEFVITVRDKK